MVKQLGNYSTISVPEEVKRVLEQAKEGKDWGTYLLDLYREADQARRMKAFQQLTKYLTKEDIENIARSSEEFRESFKFR